ncbi:MAG TPA: DMT family transporter [Gemmatimonadales bacterium]|nr:DMT family transporter [Gemmatimonadales bacterium]
MTERHRAILGLVCVAAVWGASFTAVKAALVHTSPLVLLALRFLAAAALVLPLWRGITRRELLAGAVVGLLFWGGFVFQTSGLAVTTPSRAAFITGLSTPLTPVVALLACRAAPGLPTAAGIAVATLGTWLLVRPEGGGPLNRGDLLTIGCAVLFAGQIVAAGHYAPRARIERLLVVELTLTGALSLLAAPLLETPRLELRPGLLPLVAFLAISGAGTFYYQLRGQRVVGPSQAALIFLAEPVVAAVTSYLLLGERLTAVQWLGAALILAAMALPELAPAAAGRDDRNPLSLPG